MTESSRLGPIQRCARCLVDRDHFGASLPMVWPRPELDTRLTVALAPLDVLEPTGKPPSQCDRTTDECKTHQPWSYCVKCVPHALLPLFDDQIDRSRTSLSDYSGAHDSVPTIVNLSHARKFAEALAGDGHGLGVPKGIGEANSSLRSRPGRGISCHCGNCTAGDQDQRTQNDLLHFSSASRRQPTGAAKSPKYACGTKS